MVDGPRPEPPPSHGSPKLARIGPARWWRVHGFDGKTGRYAAHQFNDSGRGDARFSPLFEPEGAASRVVPTLCAAASLDAALMEIVLHDVPYPSEGHIHDLDRDLKSPLHASQIEITQTLRLVDLTKIGLQHMNIPPSAMFETNADDYPRTRQWATWLRETTRAQGLVWMSVRQPEHKAVVLFGDRIDDAAVRTVAGSTLPLADPVVKAELLGLLDRLGCGVAPDRSTWT